MKNEKFLYDVETFINYFCVGLKDYINKEIIFYEISEERNDIDEIYRYFNKYDGFLISFNGVHYDNMVIKYILNNYENLKNKNYIEICKILKQFSDKIIDNVYDDEIKFIKYQKEKWTNIDLFLYWSRMTRISKKISLKSLGIQLGYPVVQELPFKPNTVLNKEDLPKLRYYNYTHDLGILELLLKNMEEQVNLRSDIVKKQELDAWSWDAPKIASEALLKDYCKTTNNKEWNIRKKRFIKKDIHLVELFKDFNPNFKLPIFQKLWENILNSVNSFSKEIIVDYNNTLLKLTYGKHKCPSI